MIRWSRALLFSFSLAIASASCATRGHAPGSVSHYVVTEQELANVGDLSAYDALLRLRPAFLRTRDVQTPTHQNVQPVSVFVDGARTEGLDVLRTMLARTVKEMRFYEPAEANTRFGTGNNGGAILVTMK